MTTTFDHILAGLLVVGVPLYAARFSWPRMMQDLGAGGSDARIRIYWGNIGPEWLLTAGALAAWLYADRPLADLGFALPPGWRFWVGLAAALAVAGALGLQYLVVLGTEDGRRKALESVRRSAPFAPQTGREMAHFAALSASAGICEEVLYRGFLIWYAARFTGTTIAGLALAVTVSALAFGIGHLYQGWAGALRVTGMAIVFGGLFVFSESLWIVIVLHAYVDVAGGLLSVVLHRRDT
jgi:membrane protease YdiL (CAAX protease family)